MLWCFRILKDKWKIYVMYMVGNLTVQVMQRCGCAEVISKYVNFLPCGLYAVGVIGWKIWCISEHGESSVRLDAGFWGLYGILQFLYNHCSG